MTRLTDAGTAGVTTDIPPITEPYLLVVNIPLYHHGGRHWADPLWAKDLALHLTYIRRLLLFCPIEDKPAPGDWIAVDDPALEIVAAPPLSLLMALKLPLIVARMDAAVRRVGVVHASPAGWPFPLGWIAAVLARARHRFLLINIESSFWRAPAGAGPLRRWQARLFERAARASVNAADLALFTTDQYRRTLATHPRGGAHLTPASWVDSAQVLTADAAAASWARKPGRLLFAGRLTPEKGVLCLLDALEHTSAQIDIIGEGDLIDRCRAAAAAHPERIRLLPPVAYGDGFFQLIDGYDAVIVPTLSDEQPRILFDAFARAVPAIASDTPANTEIVGASERGILVARNDARALAAAMDAARENREQLKALGLAALAYGRSATHEELHRTRAGHIADYRRK
ncbi:glycosyltransferase involved in cell wall biosynthesis [Sphingomonas vulcanisoli]|uniref:Glycosyltransferase involved in cell wall biosynthesis n=1 Tax=Sphingomonas vulcanisoli TaxID=1658060 RepID=A0ABX0TUA8_9SPHN|nr:glycosyltransferase [Sphingomonas vulcanisoli]NIJ08613.1 glycosyltransferase involved in cell wall biosynthesis [Sphingomonas vulcanisoli]